MIKTVNINGVNMNYCVFGNGQRVLVIIPGISIKPVTPREKAIAEAFKSYTEDYTVYLFDQKNDIPEVYRVKEQADDLLEAMRAVGIEKADLYGASLGGMIAQTIAIEHPEIVGKMVLFCTSSRPNDMIHEVLGGWRKLALAGKAAEMNNTMMKDIYSEATVKAFGDILLKASEPISDVDMAKVAALSKSVIENNTYDRLDHVRCETLVLGCRGDRTLSFKASEEIADKLGCEFIVYGEEFGHAAFDEVPDAKERILQWLDAGTI